MNRGVHIYNRRGTGGPSHSETVCITEALNVMFCDILIVSVSQSVCLSVPLSVSLSVCPSVSVVSLMNFHEVLGRAALMDGWLW